MHSESNLSRNIYFLLNFPQLHPNMPGCDHPVGVRFFDAVLGSSEDPLLFQPENPPLGQAELLAILEQYESLGRQCKHPSELAHLRMGVLEDFYSRTSFGLAREIAAQGPEQAAKAWRDELCKAQVLLGLAYRLEEKSLELAKLDEQFAVSWKKFENDLGLSEEDMGELFPAASAASPIFLSGDDLELPWALVLESLLAFLPEGCGLWVSNPEILSSLVESGVSFDSPSADFLKGFGLNGEELSAQTLAAKASGAKLVLRGRAPKDKPWLDKEFWLVFGATGKELSW